MECWNRYHLANNSLYHIELRTCLVSRFIRRKNLKLLQAICHFYNFRMQETTLRRRSTVDAFWHFDCDCWMHLVEHNKNLASLELLLTKTSQEYLGFPRIRRRYPELWLFSIFFGDIEDPALVVGGPCLDKQILRFNEDSGSPADKMHN